MEKLSLEDRNNIKSDYQSGMSTYEITEKYGVHRSTIYDLLYSFGVAMRMGPKKFDLPVDQIASDYDSGMSTTQLGKKYGVSRETIRNRLSEAGVQTRRPGMAPKSQPKKTSVVVLPVAQVWFEYESGTSLKDLATKYGTDEPTIFKEIQRLH